jgi:DNA-binding response OmpR family regulator
LPRVLLIDDTPEIAELLTFALRERGYDVVSCGFVTDINELVAEQHADAVVLDCSVLSNSEQLFDEIRSDAAHASLPVVLVSDTPEAADRSLRSRNAERVFLIPKPFTGSQIARALAELLPPA